MVIFIFVLFAGAAGAQTKTKKRVNIEQSDILRYSEKVVANAQRLLGNVIVSHEDIVMSCDSAWAYTNSNKVDAFGNVHIISNDTLNLWANYIEYNGDTELARARYNVILKDTNLTLYTDSLDFDLKKEIGYYNYGGKIVDEDNTLESDKARYESKNNKVFFIDNVQLINEDYDLYSDTMIYNTETEVAEFEGETRIFGDSTKIYATSGWFNTKTNETEIDENATMRRGDTQLQADYIFYNDDNGEGFARNKVIINDFANNMIITGRNARYNDFEKFAWVSDSAVWIQHYDGDSLFLHADTLYTKPDTAANGQKLLITYPNARFYRSDIQGICDSLVYFTRDSTIQMYKDPTLWSMENQMSADFIEMINNSKPPNEIYLKNNSFIIQEVDSGKFNQIKGRNMLGLIRDTVLYRIDVSGNGESIYYPADRDDYIGVNKAESSEITIYLSQNQINRISFKGSPVGTLNPLQLAVSEDTRLAGFDWKENLRPKNRYDIFGIQLRDEQAKKLPPSEIINIIPSTKEAKHLNDSIAPAKPAIVE